MTKKAVDAPVNEAKHAFLFSGQVYFHPEGDQQDVQSVHMNAIGLFAEMKVTAPELGKIQVNMQGQLRARTGKTDIVVVDVVFNSVNYLGHMTPAEWQGTTPEAQKATMEQAQAAMIEVAAAINKTVQ